MREALEQFPISMGWRLPDDRRIKVTCNARVVVFEEDKDRWLVVLENMTDGPEMADLDLDTRAHILGLSGKWAYVPDEARKGITLPLKYETLTGRIRFFYSSDPRTTRGVSSTYPPPE